MRGWPAVETEPVPAERSPAWPLILGAVLSTVVIPLIALIATVQFSEPPTVEELAWLKTPLSDLTRQRQEAGWIDQLRDSLTGFPGSVLTTLGLSLLFAFSLVGTGVQIARKALRSGRAGWLVAAGQGALAAVILPCLMMAAAVMGSGPAAGANTAARREPLATLLLFTAFVLMCLPPAPDAR